MISLELCEISFVFREIKATTAKKTTNVLLVAKIFILFEVVFIFFVFAFVSPCFSYLVRGKSFLFYKGMVRTNEKTAMV